MNFDIKTINFIDSAQQKLSKQFDEGYFEKKEEEHLYMLQKIILYTIIQ